MSIYMMSSSTDPLISTCNDGPSDLSLRCFKNNKEILGALTTLEYPWDDMHHHLFFLLEELVSHFDQFSMETKDFIHGKVDWFKNPIPAHDAFEEGNMENIFPTIKIDISTNSEIVEKIMLGHLAPQKSSMPTPLSSKNFMTSSPGHTLKCPA